MPVINFNAATFAPAFALYATSATLTSDASDSPWRFDVIDRTSGYELQLEGGAVETYEAAALARMIDLTAAGLDVETDLDAATLTFNSESWTVLSHRRLPTPQGRALGLLLIVLVPAAS